MGLSSTNGGYLVGNGSSLFCTMQGGDYKYWKYTCFDGYFAMYLSTKGGGFIVYVGNIATGQCSVTKVYTGMSGYSNTITATVTYHAASSTVPSAYAVVTLTVSGTLNIWPAILVGNGRNNLIVGVSGSN